MRLAALLAITEGRKNELTDARKRGLLPFADPAEDAGWAEYSLEDAVRWRAFCDLTRGGLKGAEAKNFIENGALRLLLCGDMHTLFGGTAAAPHWIARECYAASYIAEFGEEAAKRGFSVKVWGGTHAEILSAVDEENRAQKSEARRTISLHFYDMTTAEAIVRRAAQEFGLPEMTEARQ